MRTTVTIDDELLAKAAELTGITENAALLRQGLQALIPRIGHCNAKFSETCVPLRIVSAGSDHDRIGIP